MALEGWIARTQIKQTAAIKPWIQDEHWFVIVLQKLKLEPLPEREEMLEQDAEEIAAAFKRKKSMNQSLKKELNA